MLPRSIITNPKPTLCKSRSVTRSACSTGAIKGFRESCLLRFLIWTWVSEGQGSLSTPQRTQSKRSKSIPAAAAERGSNESLASTRAQTSWRWVAAARVACRMLLRPEEAGPQISERHPRGKPSVRRSSSGTPLETISGNGRTDKRDAGLTADSLGIAARRSAIAEPSWGEKATGRTGAAMAQKSEEEDIESLRISGNARQESLDANQSRFAFYSPREDSATGPGVCQAARKI